MKNDSEDTKQTAGKNTKNKLDVTAIGAPNLSDKIYEIRGEKVMLDFDLAEIYGYETKYLNRQVFRNIEKFDEDFMFQLTENEAFNLRCQNVTSRVRGADVISSSKLQNVTSSWGGSRYLPYAFTEQGIYMLMTVLKGDLAIKQSKALIRMFRAMKDYIVENREALDYRSNLRLMMQVVDNAKQISEVKNEVVIIEEKIEDMSEKINNAVMRSELAPVLLDFKELPEHREYLIWNGRPMRAKETYLGIFKKAKKDIVIVDNYIDIRTLRLLGQTRENVRLVVLSDNMSNGLHKSDYADFRKEFPKKTIEFYKTNGAMHDRFVIVDHNKVYHCGASVKDAGNKLTMIVELCDDEAKSGIYKAVRRMMEGERLELR